VHIATVPHISLAPSRVGLCALTQPVRSSAWSQTCYRFHTRYQAWPYDSRLISLCAYNPILSLRKLVAVIGRHKLNIIFISPTARCVLEENELLIACWSVLKSPERYMFNPSARPAVTSGYAWLPISLGTTVSGAEARDRSADRHLETSNLIGSSRRLNTLRCHVKKKLLYSHLHEDSSDVLPQRANAE